MNIQLPLVMASRAFGNTAVFWHCFLQALWAVSASPDFEAIVSLTWDCCSSVTHSVVSDSLLPCGMQHARFLCPSLSPRACSNSCPLSWWYHTNISSSVVPFSSCLQFFRASRSFQWVGSSYQVAKLFELQLQHQSFQWIFRVDFFRIDWTVEIRKSLFSRHWIRRVLTSQKCT